MKIRFLSILFILTCCENSEKPIVADVVSETLIFIDKSLSVSYDGEELAEKCKNKLSELIDGCYNSEGDRVGLFYIHERTNGASVAIDRQYHSPNACAGLSKVKALQCIKRNKSYCESNRRDVYEEIHKAIELSGDKGTERYTDIFGILEHCSSRFLATNDKNIYIFSDMVQSTKYRELNEARLKSKGDALKLALQDKQWIDKNLTVNENLKGCTIHVILPSTSMNPNKINALLKVYWTALFEQYGMTICCWG